VDGQNHGPVLEAELAALAQAGTIGADTCVWREGLPDWMPYAQAFPPPAPTAPAQSRLRLSPSAHKPAAPAPSAAAANLAAVPHTGKHADAIQLIEAHQPLRKLKPYFQDTEAALTFYGNYMRQKHSEDAAPTPCVCCGQNPGQLLIEHYWEGLAKMNLGFEHWNVLLLLFGYLSVMKVKTFIGFSTVHVYCQRCVQRSRWRLPASRFLRLGGTLLTGFSIFFLVIGGLGYLLDPHRSQPGVLNLCGVMFVMGMLGIAAGIGVLKLARALRVPAPLRSIERPPFVLKDILPIPVLH
jgi:hypothetical protein